jgi:predicted DNA-binding transcriptional regulator YafY
MPRITEDSKRDRIDRTRTLIERHPDGLTEREIAEALNFERRTAHNYLRELELQGKIYKDDQLWCPLPYKPLVLRKMELQPEEAMTLYLAARLFVKQSDQRNEAAENALTRLAQILSSDMGLGDDILQAAYELANRPTVPGYEDTFRTIMRGYIYRRKVKIVYHPYRGGPFETVLSPYLLEPSAIGFATYIIGHSSVVDALRTFKLERITHAQLLLQEEYTVPPDFPGLTLLRNAWSIYHGEELHRVVLRFHPDVVRRVQETNWHPSQHLSWDKEQPGYLLTTFEVADTTDLKPWIRTWGANCEVLEPPALRDEMIGEVRQLAEVYGWKTHRATHADEDDPLGLNATFSDYFG